MATPTRIVVYFDDGTSIDIPVAGMSSVFLKEADALKCGHKKPWTNPPTGGAATLMSASSGGEGGSGGGGGGDATIQGGQCYYYNGVIVCP
ncbi:MAG TPA: hypothetical protein VGD49_05300 [Longimicrobiales bacterium]